MLLKDALELPLFLMTTELLYLLVEFQSIVNPDFLQRELNVKNSRCYNDLFKSQAAEIAALNSTLEELAFSDDPKIVAWREGECRGSIEFEVLLGIGLYPLAVATYILFTAKATIPEKRELPKSGLVEIVMKGGKHSWKLRVMFIECAILFPIFLVLLPTIWPCCYTLREYFLGAAFYLLFLLSLIPPNKVQNFVSSFHIWSPRGEQPANPDVEAGPDDGKDSGILL